MSSTALKNPDMFPAKCCFQEIPTKALVEVMSPRNRKRYILRWEENNIPPLERLYCPRATCSRWIPPKSTETRLGYRVCPHCRAKVCSKCGDLFHLGWSCSKDSEIKAMLQLAKDNNWQRCSNCLYLVEKVDGCNHIVCRCGHRFCYLCGQRGRCGCPARGEDEELDTDGDINVNTLAAAMEQGESAGEPS
ncbi:unnamed protein product [Penicillium nalgiovense]|nr:unnamed protein product [Penicillium nalgiovense]